MKKHVAVAAWFVGTLALVSFGVIDGAISPQINGTGSEDYYLACFWPSVDFDTPFGGVAGDVMLKGGGDMVGAYYIPSSYSRFHLEAPIPFYRSIDARIQHGGLSHIRSNYRSLAFAYLKKEPALRQTDFIDVGNSESERAHRYKTQGPTEIVTLDAKPEGAYFETSYKDTGRSHGGGTVSFRVSVDPENCGVRLRRRIDQGSPRQKARVTIDGKVAGDWTHGYHNEHLRWFDLDFDIHPDLTQGKSSIDVKLSVVSGEGHGALTDFRYEVYSFLN